MDALRRVNLHLQLVFFKLEKWKMCSEKKLGEAKVLFPPSFLPISLQVFTFLDSA